MKANFTEEILYCKKKKLYCSFCVFILHFFMKNQEVEEEGKKKN